MKETYFERSSIVGDEIKRKKEKIEVKVPQNTETAELVVRFLLLTADNRGKLPSALRVRPTLAPFLWSLFVSNKNFKNRYVFHCHMLSLFEGF